MKRGIVPILAVLFVFGFQGSGFAGGVDNKQNQSAAYVGSVSRNGAIDGADIAAYNPGGIMELENGLFLEVDSQFITFDYSHQIDGRDHEADYSPIVPSLFSIYKQDKWAVYGTFTVVGGGSVVEYDDGNIITHAIGNVATAGVFSPALNPGGTLGNQFAGAESYDYALTSGLSYKINDIFSVSGGVRYVLTDKDVDIHATYTQGGTDTYIVGKYKQEADGFGGVFGLNIRPIQEVNIGLKYETRVKLDWETTIDSETLGTVGENILQANNRVNGKSYRRDLAGVLAAGVAWNVTPEFSISPSYTLYLEKGADYGDKNGSIRHNSYDLALSMGYAFTPNFFGTIGYMYTDVGINTEDFGIIEKMSPPLDCHTFAVGGKYKFNDRWSVTSGLMGSFYVSDSAPAVPATLTPAVSYEKRVYALAINCQYRFF